MLGNIQIGEDPPDMLHGAYPWLFPDGEGIIFTRPSLARRPSASRGASCWSVALVPTCDATFGKPVNPNSTT